MYSSRISAETNNLSLSARARSRTNRSNPPSFRCADTTTLVSRTTLGRGILQFPFPAISGNLAIDLPAGEARGFFSLGFRPNGPHPFRLPRHRPAKAPDADDHH